MTKPHWRIWVDWKGNGVWGEKSGVYNEDVTDDVMALRWNWGKSLAPARTSSRASSRTSSRASSRDTDRAGAAGLELTLRNHDRKYSPGNATSPLAGNPGLVTGLVNSTGRKVWAAFAYPYDDFDGGDGSDLSGRTLPVGDGLSWVKETAGSSGLALAGGNRVRPVSGGGEAAYTLDFGEADAHIGFLYNRASNGKSGVVLRYINQWDYLRVRFGDSGTALEDITWGYPTGLRRGDALAAGVNYFIEIELHGSSVRLFATDLDGGTSDRKEILDRQGNAGNLAATRHGLWYGGTTDGTTDGNGDAGADRWGGFGGWRSFFYGALEHIAPVRDPELGDICRLRAKDELERLARTELFNLLSGRNLTSGAIANRILTWSGFSLNHRQIDAGQTLVATEPRALWRIPARSALYDLQEEEDGFSYLDGRGYFRLEAAGHRQGEPHTVPKATFRDTLAGSPYFSQLAWDAGSSSVENAVAFRYRLAENRGLQEIWRLRDVPAIPAGESRDFLAESGSYEVVDGIRPPLAATDYAANSRADGSGTDLTENIGVSLPYASGEALRQAQGERGGVRGGYQGKGTLVRVANNHASATAYVTLLRLRADQAYQDFEATSYRAEDMAGQGGQVGQNGQSRQSGSARSINCRYIDNYAAARQGAEARLSRRNMPHARLTLTLPNGDGKNLVQVVHRVLSDRVRVVCSDPAVNGDFFIEGMELDAVSRTGEVTARWLVQEAW